LLQHRGAIWFKTLLEPKGHNSKSFNESRFKLSSLSDVLDAMQSWLAPVIAFGLWLLLVTGTISRGCFTFCNLSLLGVYGIRAFISIVKQRLATLKRVSAMVKQGTGTIEDQRRRQGFIKSKTIALVFDLLAVATATVFLPVSLLCLGASFSSRQYALHNTIFMIPTTILLLLFFVSKKKTQRKPKAGRNRSAMVSKAALSSSLPSNDGKSMVSGLSEISESQF
jgi:hypothetical protein